MDRERATMNAATAIATDGGYVAVRMRVVADRAGIAVGSLYRYFPSKSHLLVSVLTREFARLDDEGDWATTADTPWQRLEVLNGEELSIPVDRGVSGDLRPGVLIVV